MKLMKEEQILDINFRKQVILEIVAQENVDRKNRELRKYEIFRDRTRKWVIEALSKEFKAETVKQMENRAANISICRKVVNKLAQCYAAGVDREPEVTSDGASIDQWTKALKIDSRMKKTEKYERLFKNCILQVVPRAATSDQDGQPKQCIELRILPPYLYDVIEDCYDRERPRVVILNEFVERNLGSTATITSSDQDGRMAGIIPAFQRGNRIDETIADSPEDDGSQERHFIWWSDKYHFTTDSSGEYVGEEEITPADKKNPIDILPFVNFSQDQDGEFWAEGGEDLIDGSILVNVTLTDLFAIANAQGWGQSVITGSPKSIPKRVEGGPHRAIIMEYETGDPTPGFTYATSNPPIDAWMRMVEMYVALLLSTNNLAPRNVAGKLDVNAIASGVALMIEQSDCTDDIQDKQQLFRDKEPEVWERVLRWQKLLQGSDSLVDEQKAIPQLTSSKIQLKFHEVKPVVTEMDRLATLKARKDLGLNTLIDLIKLDNPGMDDKAAEKKLLEIVAEKLKNRELFATPDAQAGNPDQGANQNEGTQSNQAAAGADERSQPLPPQKRVPPGQDAAGSGSGNG